MDNLDFYYDSQGHAVTQDYLGSTFRYTGMSYTYSDDLGQTWRTPCCRYPPDRSAANTNISRISLPGQTGGS